MSLASPIGDEDPDLPWITPANLRKTQASDARHAGAPKETTRVGCITTDYAMQSVLLQMGLKLLSVDGMLLRSIKQWVLRCSGCYKAPRLDAGCTSAVPRLYLGCTSAVSRLYLGCASAVPSAVSRLYFGYISAIYISAISRL